MSHGGTRFVLTLILGAGTVAAPRSDTAGEAGDLSWVKFPELKCWSFMLKIVNRKAKILCT